MTGYRVRDPSADLKEPVMGDHRRDLPRPASCLLAGHLIPGRGALGLAVICVTGIAGHSGDWAPASLFHMAASEAAEPS